MTLQICFMFLLVLIINNFIYFYFVITIVTITYQCDSGPLRLMHCLFVKYLHAWPSDYSQQASGLASRVGILLEQRSAD